MSEAELANKFEARLASAVESAHAADVAEAKASPEAVGDDAPDGPTDMASSGISVVADADAGQDTGAAELETEPSAPEAKKKARLDELAKLERARVEKSRARKDQFARERAEIAQQAAQIQQLRAQVEAEKASLKDPTALLDMFEKSEGGVEKLIAYINAAKDPKRLAAAEARKELDPIISELRAFQEHQKRALQAQADQQTLMRAESTFKDIVAEFADGDAKYTARSLAKNERRTLDRAHAIADEFNRTGKQWNFHDIAVKLEADLRDDAALSADPTGSGATGNEAGTQDTQTNQAVGKAKSVSNRDASARTTIEPIGGKRRSYEERIARAQHALRAMK